MRKTINNGKQQSGFTIIEVVLVLAIAGLIFLIVFLALPQLQKSRRDTQRKSDAGRALSAMEAYSSNTNGSYPTDDQAGFDAFVASYLTNGGGVFGDPSTGSYTWVTDTPNDEGEIQYRDSHICSGATATTTGASTRDIVVVVYQESGGTSCQDNR